MVTSGSNTSGSPARLIPASLAALAALAATVVIDAAQAPSPGQQLPTFRAEVRLIEVDAIVRDEDGDFVPGLTKDDFEVLEDGEPRDIGFATMVNLPVDRSGRPVEHEGDLSSFVGGTESLDAGRVYVVMLDSGDGERIRALASRFVREFLGPTDLMAVVHVGRPDLVQGLTNDKERCSRRSTATAAGAEAYPRSGRSKKLPST
jgi:hypothetical protein